MAGKSQKQKKTKLRAKPTVAKRTPKRRTAAPVLSARPPVLSARAPVKPVKMRIVSDAAEPSVSIESTSLVEPSHEMIAQRAFENWAMHLRLAHDAVANWLEAESQLRDELNPR